MIEKSSVMLELAMRVHAVPMFLLLVAASPALLAVEPQGPLPNAVHLLGMSDVARYAKGILTIENGAVKFKTETVSAQIPLASISEYTMEQETKGLLRGGAGRLLLLAPFGSGRLVSMIRTGVETVTLQYTDVRGGYHGCIVMLPKGDGARFSASLKQGGVTEGAPPGAEAGGPVERHPQVMRKDKLANNVIQVEQVSGADMRLPSEFRVSIYEQLVDGLWKSGSFQHVYRAGDRDAETKPDRLKLQITVSAFQKGNERVRILTAFGGATSITARVQVFDTKQETLVDTDIAGSVRAYGENLDATDNLAKKVAKLIHP